MDKKARRTILRKIPYGLYILTTRGNDGPVAAIVSFVTQSSIDPPEITLAMKAGTSIYYACASTGAMALHFIPAGESAMAEAFFKFKDFDESQINGFSYTSSEKGIPLLDKSPMILELNLRQITTTGDHHLFTCEVDDAHLRDDTDILTIQHTNWHYGG